MHRQAAHLRHGVVVRNVAAVPVHARLARALVPATLHIEVAARHWAGQVLRQGALQDGAAARKSGRQQAGQHSGPDGAASINPPRAGEPLTYMFLWCWDVMTSCALYLGSQYSGWSGGRALAAAAEMTISCMCGRPWHAGRHVWSFTYDSS